MTEFDEKVWTGHARPLQPGLELTPFGLYDVDVKFQSDAPKVADWCARRLGYPVQNVELLDINFYTCFEEAISEYSAQVNQWNIRNNLPDLYGKDSRVNYTGTLVQGSFLPTVIRISDSYGTLAGVGGRVDVKTGSVELQIGQQDYDLKQIIEDTLEGGRQVDIVRVFHERTPAVSRFFDPYAISGYGTMNMMDTLGFGAYSPSVQFVLMPLYEDLLRMQAIEFNDQIRKSGYSFNITNNNLTVLPVPAQQENLWLEYIVREDWVESATFTTSTVSSGSSSTSITQVPVISDYSNIKYDFISYSTINDVGIQWIRKYTLALAKEVLGGIREKYSSIPIPNAEISLDGAALRAEANTEKELLITQLRENLEALSKKTIFEDRAAQAQQQMDILKTVPLPIFIG
jgi:hypothetical protein